MKKILIYCEPQSCRRRSLDAAKLKQYFEKNDFKIVYNPKQAEIIIYITCAAVEETTVISTDKIKKFQKYDAELIVMGCLPVVNMKELNKIFNGRTLGTKDINQIDYLFPENKIKFKEIEDTNILNKNKVNFTLSGTIVQIFGKQRLIQNILNKIKLHILRSLYDETSYTYMYLANDQFHIRISWGCPFNCSYCTINTSTGPFHSKPLDECIKEFKKGLNSGYKSFIITADNVGAYGIDINKSLPELLDRLTESNEEYKIIIRDLNPQWLVKYIDEIEEILKRNKIIILDVPIQSSSQRILKSMNRYSDIEKIKDAFVRIKSKYPSVTICTHMLVGFPTEKIGDIEDTLDFIKEVGIDAGQVFSFSLREETKAKEIEPKIPKKEILKRLKYVKKRLKDNNYIVRYSQINSVLFDKRY